MDRRSFLKTTGAAAGAAALPTAASATTNAPPAAPAVVSGRERLTVATRFPLDQPGTSTLITQLRDSLSAMTGGRIEIGTLVPPSQSGDTDLVLGFPSGEAEPGLGLDIVGGRPGGFDEPATFGWLTFGGGYRLWSELALESGHKVFYAGHTGAPLVWARQESYHDLAGHSVHVDGFAGRVARALSALPPEGPVEMAEGLSPLADTMHQSLAAFAACGESPFHTHGRMLSLTMPIARWRALSPSDQAIIEHAIAAAAPGVGAELATHRRMARLTIERRNRPTSVLFDRTLVRRIEMATADLMADAARRHDTTSRIVASLEGFRRLTAAPAPVA